MERDDYLLKNIEKYPTLKPGLPETPKQKGDEKWNQVQPEIRGPQYKPVPQNPVIKKEIEPYNRQPEKHYEPKYQETQPVVTKPYQPVPKQEEKRWEQPKEQPVIKPKPGYQPKPNVQPKQNYKPKQNYQPAPKQNNPTPKLNMNKKQ